MFLRHPAPGGWGDALCRSMAIGRPSVRRLDHRFRSCSFRTVLLRLQATRVGMCQPWFYRRLEAYGFVGLSKGA